MKGAKRFAISSSVADTNDSSFRNKRIMTGSPFDAQRAEPSQQQSAATPPLDPQRAELSRQHVKSLNMQFASWVQLQLKNHPDELWQDGVQDYLTYSSNIMERFSDVVNWLKVNAVNGDSLSAIGSHKNETKMAPEISNTESNIFQGKTGLTPISSSSGFSLGNTTQSFSSGTSTQGFSSGTTTTRPTLSDITKVSSPMAMGTNASFTSSSSTANLAAGAISTSFTAASSRSNFIFGSTASSYASAGPTTSFTSSGMTTSFSTPWSSGLFSNSQTPVLFGIQNSVAVNNNASGDADDEDELPQPSSPSLKKSEEKGIVVVHEVKCKLYVKSTDPADKDTWKDKGTGQLSIKCKEGISKGSADSKPTIVVRNDVGKVLLNALLYPGIKTNAQKNSLVAIFHTSDGDDNKNAVARTFLIRTKSEEDRNKLATAIQEYAPAS